MLFALFKNLIESFPESGLTQTDHQLLDAARYNTASGDWDGVILDQFEMEEAARKFPDNPLFKAPGLTLRKRVNRYLAWRIGALVKKRIAIARMAQRIPHNVALGRIFPFMEIVAGEEHDLTGFFQSIQVFTTNGTPNRFTAWAGTVELSSQSRLDDLLAFAEALFQEHRSRIAYDHRVELEPPKSRSQRWTDDFGEIRTKAGRLDRVYEVFVVREPTMITIDAEGNETKDRLHSVGHIGKAAWFRAKSGTGVDHTVYGTERETRRRVKISLRQLRDCYLRHIHFDAGTRTYSMEPVFYDAAPDIARDPRFQRFITQAAGLSEITFVLPLLLMMTTPEERDVRHVTVNAFAFTVNSMAHDIFTKVSQDLRNGPITEEWLHLPIFAAAYFRDRADREGLQNLKKVAVARMKAQIAYLKNPDPFTLRSYLTVIGHLAQLVGELAVSDFGDWSPEEKETITTWLAAQGARLEALVNRESINELTHLLKGLRQLKKSRQKFDL